MKFTIAIASLTFILMSIPQAYASKNIVCEGTAASGKLTATLSDGVGEKVKVLIEVKDTSGRTTLSREFNADEKYDGHETDLITAPGLSMRMANDYGCIRRVAITTDTRGGGTGFIETVEIPSCTGGQTDDALCGLGSLGSL